MVLDNNWTTDCDTADREKALLLCYDIIVFVAICKFFCWFISLRGNEKPRIREYKGSVFQKQKLL